MQLDFVDNEEAAMRTVEVKARPLVVLRAKHLPGGGLP
jgi:hypothetical protein